MGWLISVIETQDDRIGFAPGHEPIHDTVVRELGWIRHGETTTHEHKDAA